MSIELYLAFILACLVLAITPGPNMSLFISNGATHGVRAALLTVIGSSLGLSVLVAAAALGMTASMRFMADWFDIIRWIGAAYLIWLGASRLRAAWLGTGDEAAIVALSGGRWFWQGAAVSLSNPKVLLFLGAFFPQFIDPTSPAGPQLALLAVTFVLTIAAVDCAVASAAGSARAWFTAQRRRVAEGVSGVFLLCGGLWLAAARRA
jgi:threonine/homoserine/homoserine lactone efflux protein